MHSGKCNHMYFYSVEWTYGGGQREWIYVEPETHGFLVELGLLIVFVFLYLSFSPKAVKVSFNNSGSDRGTSLRRRGS